MFDVFCVRLNMWHLSRGNISTKRMGLTRSSPLIYLSSKSLYKFRCCDVAVYLVGVLRKRFRKTLLTFKLNWMKMKKRKKCFYVIKFSHYATTTNRVSQRRQQTIRDGITKKVASTMRSRKRTWYVRKIKLNLHDTTQ